MFRLANSVRLLILLRLPSAHLKSSGRRAFFCQAPLLWNNLPYSLRHSSSKQDTSFLLWTLNGLPVCVQLCAVGFVCVYVSDRKYVD